MLFTSPFFLFCFLPLLLVLSTFVAAQGTAKLGILLFLFSLFFYASWDIHGLLLLTGLICLNYFLAEALVKKRKSGRSTKGLLCGALVVNLLPLLYYKYALFFVENISFLLGTEIPFVPPSLPAGISFYTFIQIAWLVSVARGSVEPEGLGRHALFSTFFPAILSGPIIRYEQMGPQFDNCRGPNSSMLALGFGLFIVGMAKKVLLADTLAFSANAVFSAAEKAWPLTATEAWLGSLSYSFQLYFDFSGYTDMAIGIGLMLGLQLPENFISPYKATGIVDFWRRWHITLGVWLRDFLYIPLGGNRRGKIIQYRNLFLTMLIGGAWHGAGWTFIIWGALHGFMLCINHFFRAQIKGTRLESIFAMLPFRIVFIAITFFCLNLCWVFFRSPSLGCAKRMFEGLFASEFVSQGLQGTLSGALPNHYFQDWSSIAVLILATILVFAFPCSHEIFSQREDLRPRWLHFQPTGRWAVGLALLAFASTLLLSRKTVFLYFQF